MRLASVNFHKAVKVPNADAPVSGCHAVGNIANKDGLRLDYDEEYGFLRISAVNPRTDKDIPRIIFRENIADAITVEDLEKFVESRKPVKKEQTKP